MKRAVLFLISFVIMLGISQQAAAQAEFYIRSNKGKAPEKDFNVFYSKKISDSSNLKGFVFYCHERNWSECYAGLSFTPAAWLTINLGLGLEQTDAEYRIGGSLVISEGRHSLSAIGELGDGLGNYFFKFRYGFIFPLGKSGNANLELGAMYWRFHGLGPMLQYSYKDIGAWINPVHDYEFGLDRIVFGCFVLL